MLPLGRALLIVSLTAASAAAQTPAQLNPAGRGTELGGSVGAAHTASHTALVVSGTADWRLTRPLAGASDRAVFMLAPEIGLRSLELAKRGNDAFRLGGLMLLAVSACAAGALFLGL